MRVTRVKNRYFKKTTIDQVMPGQIFKIIDERSRLNGKFLLVTELNGFVPLSGSSEEDFDALLSTTKIKIYPPNTTFKLTTEV